MIQLAIVDDNPAMLMLLEVLLEGLFALTCYVGGEAALDGIASDRPNVVLLDVSMPGMDGYETLDQLRSANVHVPVIAVTGHDRPGSRERLLARGFDGYLPKPVMSELDVQREIDRVLSAS
jgi:CheY-like chemotaxis protein